MLGFNYNSKVKLVFMKSFIQKTFPGVTTLSLFLPSIAGAAGLDDVITTAGNLLNMLVPIILTLAIIYFMFGLLSYIIKTDKEEARNHMIWGIIAIAVMVSIWGLVGILQSTLGIQGQNTPIVPATVQVQ